MVSTQAQKSSRFDLGFGIAILNGLLDSIESASNPSSTSMVVWCWLVCVIAIRGGGLNSETGTTLGIDSSLAIAGSVVSLMDLVGLLDEWEGMVLNLSLVDLDLTKINRCDNKKVVFLLFLLC